jgi:hypothetical protein
VEVASIAEAYKVAVLINMTEAYPSEAPCGNSYKDSAFLTNIRLAQRWQVLMKH